MSRVPSTVTVPRMLALTAWIAAQPGGASVSDICERFDITRSQLTAQLNTVMVTGVPPYTPDTMVDVLLDDDWVSIKPKWLDRSLSLTAAQGLALLAAAESLHDVPGSEPDGPLARALDKLAQAVRARPGHELDVHLGDVDKDTLAVVEASLRAGSAIKVTYYSANADRIDTRIIEPWVLRTVDGAWQVDAWCQTAGGVRTFRLDRMRTADDTGTPATTPRGEVDAPGYHPRTGDVPVTLILDPELAWAVDRWATQSVDVLDDGRLRVELLVGAAAWLQRVLLAAGPRIRVEECDMKAVADTTDMAQRILARYRP
jgi:proteasome accessory factor C